MDLTDAPITPPVKRTLSHAKTVRPSETPSEQAAASVSSPGVSKAPGQPVYPSATRRLPGSKDAAGLPVFGVPPELANAMAAKRVYERVLSIQPYIVATLAFSVVIIFFVITHTIALYWYDPLGVLQTAGCAALVVPVATFPVLFASKHLPRVKAMLRAQMAGYLLAFVAAFVTIVNNFAYFFSGTGLLALAEAGFFFWTRSVLNEVSELPVPDSSQVFQ
ncbi:MAG TPA: hypothetical protein VLE99_04195 [Candidatus Saccharimonadales bacterium]|nr:hypothetical protein [Candidatus Saccharimonadales bacterium]